MSDDKLNPEIINQFAISLLQQNSLDDLLWSMASNIGELLGFEDCVIYLIEGDLLIQKAAFGVKNPKSRNIKNQIKIQLGEGIVGSVGLNAQKEYVPDLSKDSRYIEDEFKGCSELAVPLLYEAKVIGVLDSESSKVDGFDQRDLKMFESLANIAGARIASAIAQADKEAAEVALVKAKLDADKANQAKSDFIAKMSHEFKTPLNVILGFSSILKRNADPSTEEKLDKILWSGQQLLALVNESMDVIQLEQNYLKLDLRPVPIEQVVIGCMDIMQSEARKGEVHLESDCASLQLETDRNRLQQVLMNLISNAIKYNRKQGQVKVSAQPVNEAELEIVVEDTGVGINATDLQLIYEPFRRFGSRQNEIEGHGVGMMICRQLVEALHGSIHISSEVDIGTRVCLRLPLKFHEVQFSAVGG